MNISNPAERRIDREPELALEEGKLVCSPPLMVFQLINN